MSEEQEEETSKSKYIPLKNQTWTDGVENN